MRVPWVSIRVSNDGRRAGAADIVEAVSRELSGGALPAGSRLPPVRVLAQSLGMSKNTVQGAYDELVARGLIESREREGVFVAKRDGIEPIARRAEPPLPELLPTPAMRGGGGNGLLPMSTVFIDPALLPTERLSECARAVLRTPGLPAEYEHQGHPALRGLISERLRARGFDVDPEEVVVTTGSQQSLDIVARAIAVRRMGLEDPVYPYARMLFESLGVDLVPLPLDPFTGIDLDAWEKTLAERRPSLVYVITSFQNPTGYSYTSSELSRLLEICERHRVAIMEDDWGSDMLSGGEYRPTLRALGGKSVLYVNSFTKKLLPSLRVGFVAADRRIVPALVAMKRLTTLGNAWLTEAIVAEFLGRGYYDAHLTALQAELDARYEHCLAALAELMPKGVRWTRPGGGPTLWLELPREVDLTKLERELAARGVAIQTGRDAFVGTPHLHGVRISYAFLPPARLRTGLERMAAVLNELPISGA